MTGTGVSPGGRLGQMVEHQRQRREAFRAMLRRLRHEPTPARPAGGLRHALEAARDGGSGRLPLIAEVKRRSPSAGAIAPDRDAVDQAARYAAGGAAAISVLANETYFGGNPEDVRAVSASPAVGLPVLFKDVVVWPEQIELARRCGASAVLLIMAALATGEVEALMACAREAGLDVVVEVHDEEELERALSLEGVGIVGVNNRDLRTFAVDTSRARSLLPRVPRGVLRLAESGYRTPADIVDAWAAGADAVLVGEALMRTPDPEAFLAEVRRLKAPWPPGVQSAGGATP